MTEREQKTIRWGGAAIVLYLLLFFGVKALKAPPTNAGYEQTAMSANNLKIDFEHFETRRLQYEKLNDTFKIHPEKWVRNTIVADASAAIQNAATSGGIGLGPVRESSARASAKELATMQLEGAGPVPAIMKFLHQVTTLGYPLVIDSLQINPDNSRPGNIKINLSIVVLDYEQWKKGPNA